MTEEEWLTATYPPRMIRFLSARITDQEGAATGGGVFPQRLASVETERGRKAVETFEGYADGGATAEQFGRGKEEAWQSNSEIPNPEGNNLPEKQFLGQLVWLPRWSTC